MARIFDGIRIRSSQCRANCLEDADDHIDIFLRLGVQGIPPLLELVRILDRPLHDLSIGQKQYAVKPISLVPGKGRAATVLLE